MQPGQPLILPDGQALPWKLLRSARRSIGFVVTAQGLTVRAPQHLALAAIARAVQEKTPWIARAWQRMRAQRTEVMGWEDGARLDYLGQSVTLRLQALPGTDVRLCGNQLLLPLLPGIAPGVAPCVAPEAVRACVQRWMMAQARAWFALRLAHFAPMLGVQYKTLRLSSARTRWGSASTRGTISLHWRLMQHAAPVIDYVVVHELAHLRHMNHSARFWATVASVLPHWRAQRQVLQQKRLPHW